LGFGVWGLGFGVYLNPKPPKLQNFCTSTLNTKPPKPSTLSRCIGQVGVAVVSLSTQEIIIYIGSYCLHRKVLFTQEIFTYIGRYYLHRKFSFTRCIGQGGVAVDRGHDHLHRKLLFT